VNSCFRDNRGYFLSNQPATPTFATDEIIGICYDCSPVCFCTGRQVPQGSPAFGFCCGLTFAFCGECDMLCKFLVAPKLVRAFANVIGIMVGIVLLLSAIGMLFRQKNGASA
jgi:hypothetical protein